MPHLMPIITPRLVLRPPTLGDLDSIQTAKEDAWPICNVGWPGPSTTNGRGKRWKILFDERWIIRVKQESHWPDSIGSTGISSSEQPWILPMSEMSMRLDTGWRLNTPDRGWLPRRQTQL